MTNYLIPTYKRLPVSFTKGKGVWLFDDKGDKYLDALTGIAVCGLGHAHPAVTAAITNQAENLLHTSNLYGIPNQEALAEKLCRLSGLNSSFFCNSGAEANEAAIKIARLYGNKRKIKSPTIIVAQGSFHGRTMATLSATGNPNVQAGFEPLLDGFLRVPYNDVNAIEALAKSHHNIVAVLVEPIQGEGGIRVPSDDYLPQLRKLCDENEWLLMLDEIQTGIGRTGMFFGFEHSQIKPDVVTLAKGLGNGVPIGACLVGEAAQNVFQPGNHGSTFGGNPLACAAANAVIDTIETDNLLERATILGDKITVGLHEKLADLTDIEPIRGRGLMIGLELATPCSELVTNALEKQLLINVTAAKVVRLLPALITSDEEADQIVDTVSELVTDFIKTQKD